MPKFLTISPTHIPGKKPYAWNKFKEGNYVAIGWLKSTDLTGMTIKEIIPLLKKEHYENENSAINSFTRFLQLEKGDIVAVNNAIFGLFGIGEIISDYKFKENMHDIGSEGDGTDCYSHYRDVKWLITDYKRKNELLMINEKSWQPYGTTGTLEPELPEYIKRLLNIPIVEKPITVDKIKPDFLSKIIEYISVLRKDPEHKERAHESLVEDFLCCLGYEKHKHIKYRQGRLDITLFNNEKPVLLLEVKKDWNLSFETHVNEVFQAYRYSLEKGIRYIILTNGDYYALFDRIKGLSTESNLIGEFQLSQLESENINIINKLKIDKLFQVNINEIFQNLSECF